AVSARHRRIAGVGDRGAAHLCRAALRWLDPPARPGSARPTPTQWRDERLHSHRDDAFLPAAYRFGDCDVWLRVLIDADCAALLVTAHCGERRGHHVGAR